MSVQAGGEWCAGALKVDATSIVPAGVATIRLHQRKEDATTPIYARQNGFLHSRSALMRSGQKSRIPSLPQACYKVRSRGSRQFSTECVFGDRKVLKLGRSPQGSYTSHAFA